MDESRKEPRMEGTSMEKGKEREKKLMQIRHERDNGKGDYINKTIFILNIYIFLNILFNLNIIR